MTFNQVDLRLQSSPFRDFFTGYTLDSISVQLMIIRLWRSEIWFVNPKFSFSSLVLVAMAIVLLANYLLVQLD